MPILPFRGLAERGIMHDPSPYDLPPNAWSGGLNVRFGDTKAERAPVFRSVYETLPEEPAFCFGRRPSTGFDVVFVVGVDGRIWSYVSGTVTEVTAGGFTPATATSPFTGAYLGDVTYINRPTAVPQYFGPTSSAFAVLPNWDSTWRCVSLRAFSDYLIALNVTKGATANPTMVKWSDTTLAGLVPGSWDATVATNNAGENIIPELDSPIVDGMPLRNTFGIYADNQVHMMIPSGGQDVFQFRRVFSQAGAISQNCIAEVDGMHYVFGPNDIYRHDGTEATSLLDKRNKRHIYNSLNVSKSSSCFVAHVPHLQEIHFAYPSTDTSAFYPTPAGCNRAAVYNIPGDTWSFLDLPNVAAMTLGNVNGVLTWDSATAVTWDNVGGSWDDQTDSYARHLIIASRQLSGTLSSSRLLAYDFMDKGKLAFPYAPECNPPAYLERVGIDLDETGAELTLSKLVRRVYPQVSSFRSVPMTIQVGSSQTPSGPLVWSAPIPYDPVSQYKVDVRRGGRYLAFRLSTSAVADFEATGFDVDIVPNGSR